jgi:hypothetical protein
MPTHRGFMAHLKQHKQPMRALMFACAIVAAVSACASVEPTVAVQPGETFSLPVGKTATINGSGTRITFRELREDSRCPTDVTCVWAGDAKIEVIISRNGSPDDTRLISLNPPNNVATSGDVQIRFVGLTPVPRQSDKSPREYVAQLVVNRT